MEGKNIEEVRAAPESEMIQFAIGMASAWSLESIGRGHPLVKVYMIHTLNLRETSVYLNNELISILEKIDEA